MEENIKKGGMIRKIVFIPILLVALAIFFYLLLVLAYSLPTESMHDQMVESSSIFQEEGTYRFMIRVMDEAGYIVSKTFETVVTKA